MFYSFAVKMFQCLHDVSLLWPGSGGFLLRGAVYRSGVKIRKWAITTKTAFLAALSRKLWRYRANGVVITRLRKNFLLLWRNKSLDSSLRLSLEMTRFMFTMFFMFSVFFNVLLCFTMFLLCFSNVLIYYINIYICRIRE